MSIRLARMASCGETEIACGGRARRCCTRLLSSAAVLSLASAAVEDVEEAGLREDVLRDAH